MAATKKKPQYMTFVESCCGGTTGWLLVHPLDVLKVRLQLAGESGQKISTLAMAKSVVAKEGFPALYSGLSAAVMRQVVYTTSRLALYEIIRDWISGGDPKNVGAATRLISGPVAGGIAAMISCPVEVSLVRMQADGRLPAAQRRNYKHIFDALTRISKEEGVATYWRGSTPTVTRAMVVGLTQVGCYDQFKDMYKTSFKLEGTALYLAASVTAGLVYSFASLPFDTTKTRMQSQRPQADGTLKYKTTLGTMGGIVKEEGVASLWKGFGAYFGRSGGHTVAMFFALEYYKSLFSRFY